MRLNRLLVLAAMTATYSSALADGVVTFNEHDASLSIAIDGKPFASYVWRDPKVLRPYFAALHAPNGMQVTRNHPPIEGIDALDHAELHPGLWLAFGDISGADFWRNKGSVEHVEFVEKPSTVGGSGGFAVRNRYVSGGKTVCEEICRIAIRQHAGGRLVDWESQFSGPADFYFGDQEEMGLGVRVATAMTVKSYGQIINSDKLTNEKQVWGKQADWCDYNGTIDGRQVGVLIIPDPKNFRRSWFHARDYGVLVANPFGQRAFDKTKSAPSKVVVRKGETLILRFGVLVHSGPIDLDAAYKAWLDWQKRQDTARD